MENFGIRTFNGRVDKWDCDLNGHLNTRFYGRAMQAAYEAFVGHRSGLAPNSPVKSRYIRFHSELMAGATLEIRSGLIEQETGGHCLVHLLYGDGVLAATAMDELNSKVEIAIVCETVGESLLRSILPRSLTMPFESRIAQALNDAPKLCLGSVRNTEVDHAGYLYWEVLLRLTSGCSHELISGVGINLDFIKINNVNRMNVELRVETGSVPTVGSILYGQSLLLSVAKKSIVTAHRLIDGHGKQIAYCEQCLVLVNLETRKTVPVPEFISSYGNRYNLETED